MLHLLASQAAISLENARLYTDLQHENLERQQAEERLRRSEAYLAEAQRLSLTGSFGWHVASGTIVWSDETFRIFDHDPRTKPTLELIRQRTHPDDVVFVQETLERATRDGTALDFEHRLLLRDGAITYVHVVAHAVRDAVGELEYVGAVMDVTERKKAEEAMRQAQAELAHVTRVMTMGELTASIAHEVNQPLAAIVTNGNACLRWLARTTPDLEEAREAVARIIRDGKRAGEVIARIRALVRKTGAEKERLDLNDAIEEVVALVQDEVRKNRVALRLDVAADLPLVVGDRVQLQQVLLNLVMNSLEALAVVADQPRELLIRSRPQDSDAVLVTVQDSGTGSSGRISEQDLRSFLHYQGARHGDGALDQSLHCRGSRRAALGCSE